MFSHAGAELRSIDRGIRIADPIVPSHPLNEILQYQEFKNSSKCPENFKNYLSQQLKIFDCSS